MTINKITKQNAGDFAFTIASLVINVGSNLIVGCFYLWYFLILQNVDFFADTLIIISPILIGIASLIGLLLALIASWGRREPPTPLRLITYGLSIFSLPLYLLVLEIA